MNQLYKKVNLKDGEPVQFVGRYVLSDDPEMTVGFVEVDKGEEDGNDCEHLGLEMVVIDTNVYDNNDTVIVTRQDICEECGENVGEPYDQVYALIEDK